MQSISQTLGLTRRNPFYRVVLLFGALASYGGLVKRTEQVLQVFAALTEGYEKIVSLLLTAS